MKVIRAIDAGISPGTDSGRADGIAEETGSTPVFVARPDLAFCLDFASTTSVSAFWRYTVAARSRGRAGPRQNSLIWISCDVLRIR